MNTDCRFCVHHVQWINGGKGCACELEVYLGNFEMNAYHKRNCGSNKTEKLCPEFKPKNKGKSLDESF